MVSMDTNWYSVIGQCAYKPLTTFINIYLLLQDISGYT